MVRWLVVVIAFAVASCASTAGYHPIATSFVKADLIGFTGTGNRTVSGEGFVFDRYGKRRYCDGARVLLVPALPVVDEAVLAWRARQTVDFTRLPFANLPNSVRHTECNGSAKFAFKRVPPGEYWVMLRMRWVDAKRSSGLRWERSATLAVRVSVEHRSAKGLVADNEDYVGSTADPFALTQHFTTACACGADLM